MMKFRSTVLVLIPLLVLFSRPARTGNSEFRALWVHNWRPGLLSPAEVDQTVRWAMDCNMNVLIVQVRRLGDAYYDSAYEPRASNIQAGPEFDPLGYTIEQARANGLELHAWFNVFRVWKANGDAPDAGHVASLHPEWLSKDVNGATCAADGRFLDPGVPEVREHLLQVVTDLVDKYDLDGLMLDFIRYPGKNWGYNDIAVAGFNSTYGRTGKPSPDDPLWCDWRREQVTKTVRAIYNRVQQLRPGIKVSAATVAWGSCPYDFTKTSAYRSVFQDWRSWMREGILDAVMPMNYKDPSDPRQSKWFSEWLGGMKKWSYGRHAYSGLMVYKDVSGTASQVRQARMKRLPGVVGFAFSQIDPPQREKLAAKLRGAVFSEPASVPEMPWKQAVARLPGNAEAQNKGVGGSVGEEVDGQMDSGYRMPGK